MGIRLQISFWRLESGLKCDLRNEKIGYKIREAEEGKIPCMVVIGAREAKKNQVTLRRRKMGDLGQKSLPDLLHLLIKEIEGKVIASEETAR